MAENLTKEKEKAAVAAAKEGIGIKASDGSPAMIDLASLAEMLKAHAETMAAAFGRIIGEKFAELKIEMAETRRLEKQVSALDRRLEDTDGRLRELRQSQEKIGNALESAREDAWLAKYPTGDQDHLKRTERELRRLEETLRGPQALLEKEEGKDRPVFHGEEARWRLPHYEPVPPDM